MESHLFPHLYKAVSHLHWNNIIAGCKLQDPQSQEELYRGCHAGLFKLCIRYATDLDEAAAIFNEAMLKVFNTLHQFAGRGDFMGWVRRIVVNTCIDHCRRQAKFTHSAIDQVPDGSIVLNPEIYERLSARDVISLHISAEQDGQPVTLLPQKAITVAMPTDNYDNRMLSFAGQLQPRDEADITTLNWLPVGPFYQIYQGINDHSGPKAYEINLLNKVEPYSVSYGKKTTARFYVAHGIEIPKTELTTRLKQRFGSYYDVIKIKRAQRKCSRKISLS